MGNGFHLQQFPLKKPQENGEGKFGIFMKHNSAPVAVGAILRKVHTAWNLTIFLEFSSQENKLRETRERLFLIGREDSSP